MNFADIVFASILANNLLLFHFFGLGEFLGEAGPASLGKRVGILAVLLLAASAGYSVVDHFVLVALHLTVLRTLLAFAVVGLVTAGYSAVARSRTGGWPQAREFLVHSFLVGGVLLVGSSSPDTLEVITASVAAVVGYGGALAVLSAVFSRLARERIPAFLQGLPLQLLTLGLVWLVLQGLGFAFVGKGA